MALTAPQNECSLNALQVPLEYLRDLLKSWNA